MKVVLLTGSHPRHFYLARTLFQAGFLQGLVVERRAEFVPTPPEGLSELDRRNFVRHFEGRREAEGRFFSTEIETSFPGVPTLSVRRQELNSEQVREWMIGRQADVVLTYGVHKISEEMLQLFPQYAFNLHGGLSPWYRGNITLFWPFYFLRPNWSGMTIHYLTSAIDGGPIVHHSVPELRRGDGIHEVACRAVAQACADLVVLLERMKGGQHFAGIPQKSRGKLFVASDWTPQHLRLVYNTFDNDIVDRFLDGELGRSDPSLVKAFSSGLDNR